MSAYNLHLSHLTFLTVLNLLGGKRSSVLNPGQAGVGKSRRALDLVRMLELDNTLPFRPERFDLPAINERLSKL